MEAVVIDLPARTGATFREAFQYLDESGASLQWAGYTARMQVRTGTGVGDDGTPTLSLTTENGGLTFLDDGWMQIYISAAAMLEVPAATYVYDIEWVAPNGDVIPPQKGKFKVAGEVTR